MTDQLLSHSVTQSFNYSIIHTCFMGKFNVFLIVFSMFLGSCRSGSQKATMADGIITIDLSKDYPKTTKKDRDIIAHTEYVPLETTKDVLVGRYASLHTVSERFIVVTDIVRGDILILNRTGKIVSLFNHKGKGPEEYNTMSCVVFDEKNKEVFVFDYTERILVYTFTGEYKRTMKYTADLQLTAYNFDNETLLVYDTKNLYNDDYNKEPYMFMSKKDGSITSTLNINLPARYDTRVFTQFTDDSGQLFTYSSSIFVPNKRHYGQDFVISDVSSDTIYWLAKNRELIPWFVRTPSVHSTDPHLICTTALVTDKFVVFHTTVLDYASIQKEKEPPVTALMYEFESGEINRIDFRALSNVNILQKNTDAGMIDVSRLIDSYNDNKLEGGLKQLVSTLDEEDNPVVVIHTFK